MSATDVCAQMNELLAERASGPLEAEAAAALDAHLLRCPACRTAATHWEDFFSLVALPPPTLKEEAALRGLPERTLAAWQRREGRWRTGRGLLAVAGLLAAAALPLWLWQPAPPPGHALASAPVVQLGWSEAPGWDVDEGVDGTEVASTDVASDDTTLLDGLALEGDGAFALGDSG